MSFFFVNHVRGFIFIFETESPIFSLRCVSMGRAHSSFFFILLFRSNITYALFVPRFCLGTLLANHIPISYKKKTLKILEFFCAVHHFPNETHYSLYTTSRLWTEMPHSSYSAFKQYQTGRRISPVRGHAGRALSPPHGGTQHHTPHAAMIRSPHSPYEHTDASWEDASQQDYAPYHSPHDRRTRTRDTYRDREEESSHVFMHGRRSNGPPKRSWSAHSQPGRRPRSGSPKTPVRNNESSFGSHDNGQRLRFDEDHVWERDRVYDQQQSGSDGTPPRRREKGRRSPPRRESDRDRWHYERDRELFERRERELEDEVRRCKHQLHLANAEADALRRDLATRTEELSAAERELAAQRRDRGTSSRHRPSHKDAAPPMHLPPDAQSTAPPSPRRSLSSEARPQRPPKHITVQVPSQPLAEGVFTLRNGETLNGFPVWGCDDKRMYSGSREYWLITDESSDMAKSRGYVQSGKPHEGAMPHVITEWKIFDSEGWVQDRSVRVREGGTPVEKRETTRRANPSVEDTTYKPPRSTQLTKVPASVHQVQQPPAAYDSTPPGSANVSSTRLSWKGPPQRGPPQPQRTERERGTAPSLSVLSTRHATALQKGAQYWKVCL